MEDFLCTRLRMYTYLTEKGFTPKEVLPDANNPSYQSFVFDRTPELAAAVVRYYTTDCYSARLRQERNSYNDTEQSPQKRI